MCFGLFCLGTVVGVSAGSSLSFGVSDISGMVGSMSIGGRMMRRHDMWLVLPKPLVLRVVVDSSGHSVILGRAEGMKRSWAIFELDGSENGLFDVLERMTVMSPR